MTEKERSQVMKVVNINTAPTICNDDGCIRHDVTSLDAIINHIDEAGGRNDALRAYIFSLRDLQRANDEYAIDGDDGAAIEKAEAVVAEAFDRLTAAEFALSGRKPRDVSA
jgi:hypothetical protein